MGRLGFFADAQSLVSSRHFDSIVYADDLNTYKSFAKLIIKNSKVRLIQVEDENQLKKFIKQNAFGEKIYVGMGAGSISNWMKNLKNIF